MGDKTVFYFLVLVSAVSASVVYRFPDVATIFVGLAVWSGIMALKVQGVPFKRED